MGAAVPIRTDISAGKLRRLARQETEGRVACRLFGVANALDGMSRERAARQAGMDRQTLRDSLARQLLTPSRFSRLIAEFARDHPAAERLEVWFLDEARVGQTGRVGRRWYQKGNAPARVRDLRHQASTGSAPSARSAMPASPWSRPRSAPPPCRRCSTSSARQSRPAPTPSC